MERRRQVGRTVDLRRPLGVVDFLHRDTLSAVHLLLFFPQPCFGINNALPGTQPVPEAQWYSTIFQ